MHTYRAACWLNACAAAWQLFAIAHLGDGPAGEAVSATEALDQLAAGLHAGIHSSNIIQASEVGSRWTAGSDWRNITMHMHLKRWRAGAAWRFLN
jgi:hypothetical protein